MAGMLDRAVITGLRPTRAEISLGNLRHNFEVIRGLVGPDVAVMGVVKANAYGHGAEEAAAVFERAGAAWLGVALPEEGAALREAGIGLPVLCLGGFWDGQESLLLDYDLTPAVYRPDQVERLDAEAGRRGATASYHLKVDTGMGRLGVPPGTLGDFLDRVARLRRVSCDGLMTHFPSADVPELADFTRGQIARYGDALEALRRHGLEPRWRHLANGAGTHAFPEGRGNLVRPGAVLYGLKRDVLAPVGPDLALRPVMRVVTRIEHLKTVPEGTPLGYGCTFTTARRSAIATVPAGYADGVRRGLSNRGHMSVRGRLAPVVGRVSMDLTILDVTDVPGVELGDEVVLFGGGGISVEDVAEAAGTISYEITCGISPRVPRVAAP
jgi:alanine racemase